MIRNRDELLRATPPPLPAVVDGGPWRGVGLRVWLDRIAGPSLREGESWPFVKPAPLSIDPGLAPGELMELYGR